MQQKHQQHSQLSEKMFMAFLEHVLGHSAARPGRFPGMSRCNHSRFLRSSPGAWGVVSECFPRRFRDASQGASLPGASQALIRRVLPRGASQVLPWCFLGASQALIASQVLPGVLPRCFLGASRAFPSASWVLLASPGVSQVLPGSSPGASPSASFPGPRGASQALRRLLPGRFPDASRFPRCFPRRFPCASRVLPGRFPGAPRGASWSFPGRFSLARGASRALPGRFPTGRFQGAASQGASPGASQVLPSLFS